MSSQGRVSRLIGPADAEPGPVFPPHHQIESVTVAGITDRRPLLDVVSASAGYAPAIADVTVKIAIVEQFENEGASTTVSSRSSRRSERIMTWARSAESVQDCSRPASLASPGRYFRPGSRVPAILPTHGTGRRTAMTDTPDFLMKRHCWRWWRTSSPTATPPGESHPDAPGDEGHPAEEALQYIACALGAELMAMEAEQGPFNLVRYGGFLDNLPEMPWAE